MSPRLKLAGFALVLAASLGLGAAVGAAVGPIEVDDEPAHQVDDHGPSDDTGDDGPDHGHRPAATSTTEPTTETTAHEHGWGH